MEQKNGYVGMSERGQKVCEVVELSVRYEIEKLRKNVIPGHPDPNRLLVGIQKLYSELIESEKAAVVDLLAGGKQPRWEHWLKDYVSRNPGDAYHLYMLGRNFSGAVGVGDSRSIPTHIYENFGARDYPWQMQHE